MRLSFKQWLAQEVFDPENDSPDDLGGQGRRRRRPISRNQDRDRFAWPVDPIEQQEEQATVDRLLAQFEKQYPKEWSTLTLSYTGRFDGITPQTIVADLLRQYGDDHQAVYRNLLDMIAKITPTSKPAALPAPKPTATPRPRPRQTKQSPQPTGSIGLLSKLLKTKQSPQPTGSIDLLSKFLK